MVRIVLEGGLSDLDQLDLDLVEPPADWTARGERYGPVLDYWDQPMRDIFGRWRYRVIIDWQEMRPGHSALPVKP